MRTLSKTLSLFLFTMVSAVASNWYVEPSSKGSANGTNWSNAWSLSQISWSSIQPGDTIWIAGGTYTDGPGITVLASGTSSAPILIYRATAQDPAATGSPGWNSTFDKQAVIQGGINFPGPVSYVTVSGRTPSGFYWASGPGGGDGSTGGKQTSYGAGGPMTGITLQYYEMDGSANTTGSSGPTYGVNWPPTNGQYAITNCLVDHCYIHTMSETIRTFNWVNCIVQYCKIGDTNNFGDHADLVYNYTCHNTIWRYNVFYNSPGDGFYNQWGNFNCYLYGNIWYNCGGDLISEGNDNGGVDGPYFLYNNFFGGIVGQGSAVAFSGPNGSTLDPASSCYNNIFYNCDNSVTNGPGFTKTDYNAYFGVSVGSGDGSHSFTFSNNPFVNVSTGNVQFASSALAAVFANGLALATDGKMNFDMAGKQRGNPWYIGAYQYGSATPAPTPMPPQNLHVLPSS